MRWLLLAGSCSAGLVTALEAGAAKLLPDLVLAQLDVEAANPSGDGGWSILSPAQLQQRLAEASHVAQPYEKRDGQKHYLSKEKAQATLAALAERMSTVRTRILTQARGADAEDEEEKKIGQLEMTAYGPDAVKKATTLSAKQWQQKNRESVIAADIDRVALTVNFTQYAPPMEASAVVTNGWVSVTKPTEVSVTKPTEVSVTKPTEVSVTKPTASATASLAQGSHWGPSTAGLDHALAKLQGLAASVESSLAKMPGALTERVVTDISDIFHPPVMVPLWNLHDDLKLVTEVQKEVFPEGVKDWTDLAYAAGVRKRDDGGKLAFELKLRLAEALSTVAQGKDASIIDPKKMRATELRMSSDDDGEHMTPDEEERIELQLAVDKSQRDPLDTMDNVADIDHTDFGSMDAESLQARNMKDLRRQEILKEVKPLDDEEDVPPSPYAEEPETDED